MSDLISRSEFLEEIEKYKFGAISNDAEREYVKDTILNFIICQPAAYDVDRVVKELETDYSVKLYGSRNSDNYLIPVNRAIEIVKQGGAVTETETIRDKAIKWNNNSSKRVPYEFIDYVEGKREIVISDDVCEWRLCDEEANVYDTSCRNPHILINGTPEENNYRFCPYCGKKIKVVE